MNTNNITNNVKNTLLGLHEKYMHLKIFVDGSDELKNKYYDAIQERNNKILNQQNCKLNQSFQIDAGFDLYAPAQPDALDNEIRFLGPVAKLDYQIICSARMVTDRIKIFNTGYYMYPRSSLSKTKLRLANATGIVDSGYRGHLIGMFDVINVDKEARELTQADYVGNKFDRYLQICAPGLVPIYVELVNNVEELGEETERGGGGFGSTGR